VVPAKSPLVQNTNERRSVLVAFLLDGGWQGFGGVYGG